MYLEQFQLDQIQNGRPAAIFAFNMRNNWKYNLKKWSWDIVESKIIVFKEALFVLVPCPVVGNYIYFNIKNINETYKWPDIRDCETITATCILYEGKKQCEISFNNSRLQEYNLTKNPAGKIGEGGGGVGWDWYWYANRDYTFTKDNDSLGAAQRRILPWRTNTLLRLVHHKQIKNFNCIWKTNNIWSKYIGW